ncbi:MAG TPA: hypothetical protein PKY67_06385 [Nitrosomonas sp.]|nr:hypothetical protein [Nitrosomonas sp.]
MALPFSHERRFFNKNVSRHPNTLNKPQLPNQIRATIRPPPA